MKLNAISIIALALAGCAIGEKSSTASIPQDPCAIEYMAAYKAGRALQNSAACNWTEISSQKRADEIQAEVARNHPAGGRLVGYKVTNASDGRVIGVISDAMLLPSGSKVDLSTGSRLLAEGDLLVRVKSAAINQAKTLEDVASHIDQVIPFIESSDMMLPKGAARTKAIWTSSNGNARWGVMGEPIDVSDLSPDKLVERLASIEVALIDETGRQMQKSGMKNNPLQSVFDVLEDMQRRGNVQLKAGDYISLGNFGRPRFPKSGNTYTAVFHGLADSAPEVVASYQ